MIVKTSSGGANAEAAQHHGGSNLRTRGTGKCRTSGQQETEDSRGGSAEDARRRRCIGGEMKGDSPIEGLIRVVIIWSS